jgi:hypothetical protein
MTGDIPLSPVPGGVVLVLAEIVMAMNVVFLSLLDAG